VGYFLVEDYFEEIDYYFEEEEDYFVEIDYYFEEIGY